MWICCYTYPSKICRMEGTRKQGKVQLVTCLDVLGFWNGQWKDPGTDFQHPGFWGISELWWFQGGHQVTIPVASLPASLPVVHIGQGKDASIVPCSSLLLLPCHHPIWLHSQSQFLVATGRVGRYSPAAAFSGSINFRKKDLKPEIPKKGIFLEYGCIDNCDIKAEPWSFHLCLCFSRSHRVSVEAKSWWCLLEPLAGVTWHPLLRIIHWGLRTSSLELLNGNPACYSLPVSCIIPTNSSITGESYGTFNNFLEIYPFFFFKYIYGYGSL